MMLAQSRSAISLFHRHVSLRTLATASASSSHSGPEFPVDLTPSNDASQSEDRKGHNAAKLKDSQRSIFIRPWDGVQSMPQVFAITREIERRYGRVRSLRVQRDYDYPQLYLSHFWIDFADFASWEQVPESPTMIQVEVPEFDFRRPGGVGLDDLEGLLQPQYRESLRLRRGSQSVVASQDKKNLMDVKIERSTYPVHTPSPQNRRTSTHMRFENLKEFVIWGGFHNPAPNEPPSVTQHMHEVQRKWKWQAPKNVREEIEAALTSQSRKSVAGKGTDDGAEPQAEMTEEEREELEEKEALMAKPFSFGELEQLRTAEPESSRPSESQSEPSPSPSDVPLSGAASDYAPSARRLTKRERVLAQARIIARTPLPEKYTQTAEQQKRELEEKREREAKKKQEDEEMVSSLRNRLQKLIGGNWS